MLRRVPLYPTFGTPTVAQNSMAPRRGRVQVRQKAGEEADQWQEGADMVDVIDARAVRQLTQHGTAETAHAERKPEKEPGDQADAPGQEFLGIDQDRGKCRRQNKADQDAQNCGTE